MKKNPALVIDFYKAGHYFMQPRAVETVYSTWTARSNKYHPGCEHTVVFGHQGFVKEYLVDFWNTEFFQKPIEELRESFNKIMNNCFNPIYADFSRFERLHELGYLPIAVWGVPEGSVVTIRVPQAVIYNTHPEFGWLPQYLEDMWTNHNWLPSTSATTAYYRRKDLEMFFNETCDDPTAIRRSNGDFSMRGMCGEDSAYISSAGHLLSFDRTATVDANGYLEQYYGADIENRPPGHGNPSLEHSVVCQGIAYYTHLFMTKQLDDEYQAIAQRAGADWELSLIGEMLFLYHLLTKVQPTGMFTYVSDTNDYWGVLTKIAPALHPEIMARDGKIVFRPDSGTPELIVCGDPNATDKFVRMGSIKTLEYFFGSSYNTKGYKLLDSHVGLIYGDAISAKVALAIATSLMADGWSIQNIIFGIGAFTYQYVTRDTRGYAIKATNAIFAELGEIILSKTPKTDDGTKVSQRGAVKVFGEGNRITDYSDRHTIAESQADGRNMMRPIFIDGEQFNVETIYDIRDRLWNNQF